MAFRIGRTAVVAIVSALVSACGAPGQTDDTAEAASADIRAVADSFADAVHDQDPARFAALFTDSATYASNDGRLWESREEILQGARDWMRVPQEPATRTVSLEVTGDVAYVVEAYSSDVLLSDTQTVTVTGYSMAVFRRQDDGSWKIDALVVNRDPRR